MKRFQLAGWVLICLSISSVSAQTKQGVQSQYSFKQLTVDQGLSNNRVNAICEDARGFIWFGTENGADRFDGQSIISYKNDPDNPHTLSSNQINAMFLDSRGTLWFATSEGLDHYDYSQGDIVRFSHKDIKWPIGNVEAITEDQDGKLWIGAQSGLYAYDLNSSKISYFSNKEDNPLGLPPVMIYKLLADQYNNIWISPYREGLCVYDQSTETLKCFKKDPDDPTSLSGNQIERLYEDQAGNIWAGTMDDGMNKYTPGSQSFVRIIPDANNSYTTRVRAIFEDLKGNFFVGTRGGLYVQTGSMDGFMPYAYEGHNFSNLSQNSILCSYIDKSGTLWIGTFSGGVNYSDLHKKGFVHYRAGKDDNHFLNGSNIYCMTEDLYGNLWIGGDDGLNFLERSTYTFRYYLNDPDNPHSISYNDIKALEWDDKGNLWIGTNKGGLNYYDVQTGKFTAYRHDINDPASIAGDKIYGLLNDSKNDLWVITNTDQGTGYLNLDILPSGSETFIHLNEAVNYGFDQDGGGNVYIGGVNGFWVFSRSDSSFQFIEKEEWIGSVNAIRKDSENMIWVGSRKGLVRYDPFKESFISFSQSNGYPVYEVFGILEDDAKSLWVSTDVGLLRMGNIVRDPENPDIRVFDSDDGLQSKQFNYNAYYKSQSGEMMFGGINGFNTFFPKDIVDNPSVPGVVITDLKIFNKSVPIGKKVSGRQILEKSISVTKGIRLGRKQNIFTFEFAALHYADPPKNVFRYKLEGFDEDWQYRKAGNNFATYSNLPAGDYTFKVSAANPDGKWNPVPAEIKLSIIPPFWRTWWFITLLILLIGTTILFLWKMREKNLKADRERLEKQLEIGKEEIRKQQEEIHLHEEEIREKEAAAAKSLWYNEGIVKFSELISTNKENIRKLASSVLRNLISYVEANQGGIFLLDDKNMDEKTQELLLIASHAYTEDKLNNQRFMPGEGLIGTCYQNGEVIRIDNLPDDYSQLASGLGKSSPKHLVLVPVSLGDYKIGVLELISFNPVDDYKVELVEKVTESLASIVSIVRANEQALTAVNLVNEQKEELLAQEEEIRQNLEEMQATQDELLRKQDSLLLETAMLETLLDFLPERITIKDANGVYLRVNKTKLEALKLKKMEDIKGLTDKDFFGEEHFKKALEAERALMQSANPILNNEEQLRFSDGRVQWGSTSRIPFRNARGEMVGTITITKNISELKLMSGKLEGLTTLLRGIAGTQALICYETDQKGIILQIFGRGLDLIGQEQSELENTGIFTLFDELKQEVDLENPKEEYAVNYRLIVRKTAYRISHRILRNASSGGLVGCAEVEVERTTQSHTPQARQ